MVDNGSTHSNGGGTTADADRWNAMQTARSAVTGEIGVLGAIGVAAVGSGTDG